MSGTIKNAAQIEKAKDTLREVADLLQAALDGKMTLSAASKATGLTPQRMNQNLNLGFRPYIKSTLLTVDDLCETLDACRTPGDLLLMGIFEYDRFDGSARPKDSIVILPEYDEDLLWDLAREALTPVEFRILSCLTGEATGVPMSSHAIAQELCVTRERIAQKRRKAFRKLRRPNVIRKLFPAVTVDAQDYLKYVETNMQHAVSEYGNLMAQSAVDGLIRNMMSQHMNTGSVEPETVKAFLRAIEWDPEPRTPGRAEIRIEDCDMSARTYNCLHRARIDTLNQVAEMTLPEIKRVRNLGEKSRQELGALLLKHLGVTRLDLLNEQAAGDD